MAGKVSIFISEPTTPLIRPNSKATHRNVQAPPLTVTPVIEVVAAQNARNPIHNRIIKDIYKLYSQN